MNVARRGLALLIVVAVLGVLGLLAVAFVTLAQLERKASQQRLHATRALLLARSGLEDVLARLEAGQDPGHYLGEDWDASATLNGFEPAAETCRPGTLDTGTCPVAGALRPSFFLADPASLGADGLPAPRRILVDGRERGVSGKLGSQTYALKVLPAGGFHLNGGDCEAAPASAYNAVLRRMLGTLAEALDREDGVAGNGPVSAADGLNLVDLRPRSVRGWESWTQVRDTALGGSQARLDALKPYLVLEAWVDRKVIAPTPRAVLDAMAGGEYQTWADITLGRTLAGADVGRRAPGFEARAPVDLAWARTSRPALIALTAGLKGLYLDETTASSIPSRIGTLQSAEILLDWSLASDECRKVADRILTSTSELGSWDQWNEFCNAVPDALLTGTTNLRQAKRDLLKANFNPNSDLNKFNPNVSLWKSVDKSDLQAYSTEFNLVPRGGGRISSLGRVLDAQGRLLASRELSAELAQDLLARPLTTQSEFTAGNLGRPDLAGDETAPRTYGDATYISASVGIGKTFGYGILPGSGYALQAGPEPLAAATPSVYDGQLSLATVETEDAGYGPGMKFLARWETGFDADYTDPGDGGNLQNASPADLLQPAASASLWDASTPGMLRTDGLYVEQGRQPGYACKGNLSPSRGTLSFWVKPNYDGKQCSSGGNPQRGHTYLNNSRNDGNQAHTGCFAIVQGRVGTLGALYMALHWENTCSPGSDFGEEQAFSLDCLQYQSHTWHLATWFWDMTHTANVYEGTRAYYNARIPASGKIGGYYTTTLSYPGPYLDFTQPDGYLTAPDPSLLPPAVFYLGQRGNLPYNAVDGRSAPPDATFDDLAIWDFGPSPSAIAPTDTLVQNRFKAGRFYKESDYLGLTGSGMNKAGEYFSPPVDLGRVRVLRLAWTRILPPGLKAPADPGPDGNILLEMTDAAGIDYLPDADGRLIDRAFSLPAASAVDRKVSAPFRLHAVFQPNLADPANTPILDPLALDDVTVVYRPAGGRRLSSWSRD